MFIDIILKVFKELIDSFFFPLYIAIIKKKLRIFKGATVVPSHNGKNEAKSSIGIIKKIIKKIK